MKAGWKTHNLGDLCDVIGGGTPSKDKAHAAFYSGDIPWATVRDMKGDFISETEFKITKAAVTNSSTNVIPKNNVVIATRVGLGKVCMIKQDTAINQDLRGIIPKNKKSLAVPYLYWWLRSVSHVIVAEGTGATVQGVKLPFIKALQVPIPPLPEQQRIVTILDEAFEGIGAATVNAEKNLGNVREVFDRYLQTVFTEQGKGWVVKKLGDLATFRNGINFTKSSKGKSVRIVGVKDFQQHFYAPVDNLETVIADGKLPDTDFLKPNDILFVRSNGNLELIGRSLIIGELSEGTTFSGFTIRARLNDASMYPEYLCHYLKSGVARRTMIDGGNGVNIKSLNQTTLSELAIPVPPTIKEQKAVVTHLESLSIDVRRLESVYQQKLDALAELKKSILHQAFTGQLH
jgi:type I restriction enzyme S subunit